MGHTSSRPLVVGIDLGGTNMQIGVVDRSFAIIGRCKRKTKSVQGRDAVIDRLVEGVRRACEEAGIVVGDLGAVGIGAPGAIDIPHGVVLDAPNLQWKDAPLQQLLEERLGCPVVVDNDVNVAIWGEAKLGAGRGRGDMLGVWCGTGVGGGLVLNGRIWHGAFFTAGEIGQTIITPDGPPGMTTVEHHCSRTGLSHILTGLLRTDRTSMLHSLIESNDGVIGSKILADAVAAGDSLACRVVEHASELLGIAIANWITVLAIDTVILGGGVTEALGQPFVDKVKASFVKHVFPARCRECLIVPSQLMDDAGLLGAALLAADVVTNGADTSLHAASR